MFDLILEYRDEAQRLLALAVCVSSLRWGGGPERALALTWLILFELIQSGLSLGFGTSYARAGIPLEFVVVDACAGILFVWIALQANRTYPLWIAGFQLVALLAHLARELASPISPISYAIMAIGPSYFQIALLAGGLIAHVRRKRRFGDYRDWRMSAGANSKLAATRTEKRSPKERLP